MTTNSLACDGCGQPASPEHIARRPQRLEWTTRYRPVHIGTLLLGGFSPIADEEFLYAGKFQGEAGQLLEAAGIATAGKSPETILSEFQRGGFFLTHVLECPFEGEKTGALLEFLMLQRASAVVVRIRRSLKPKRVLLFSECLAPLTSRLTSAELGCPVILEAGKPFSLDSSTGSESLRSLREILATAPAAR
jgi:hypothetical protein